MALKSLIAIITLLTASGLAYGQDLKELNHVEHDKIKIVNSLHQTYRLGNAQELQKVFGKLKPVKEKDETIDATLDTYKYNGLEVSYHTSSPEYIIVNKPAYTVFLNDAAFKVGDPISKLHRYFPLSYKNRRTESTGDGLILIMMSSHNVEVDVDVCLTYDRKGIIQEISITNDNS
jgi:hypothetical protein